MEDHKAVMNLSVFLLSEVDKLREIQLVLIEIGFTILLNGAPTNLDVGGMSLRRFVRSDFEV